MVERAVTIAATVTMEQRRKLPKNKAMAKNDHFDSEDTPDEDSFIRKGSVSRKAKQPMGDDDGDEYEHGDLEANARNEDPSDSQCISF